MGVLNKFSFGVIIFVISIIITVDNVESAAADSGKFDQLSFIIINHTDIISFIDDTAPYDSGTVQVTLQAGTNPQKTFVLYQVPNSNPNLFRTIVKFNTTCTSCAANELKVSSSGNELVTLAKSGVSLDTVTTKLPTGDSPIPQYGNNNSTTNAVNCDNGFGGDSDGDAICNNWEGPNGLSINYPAGGTYTIGVSPNVPGLYELRAPNAINQKDIYLEIDYMQGHRPNVEAIWDVINAFNNMNITLHVQLDDEGDANFLIPHATSTKWPGLNTPTASKGFDQIAGTHFGTCAERGTPTNCAAQQSTEWQNTGWIRKHQVFHYALFTHAQSGSTSSGVSEVGGDELMITLGVLNDINEPISPDQIAGTLMHEIGHNLNLNHGGDFNDQITCKPTHMSVMDYARQWSDLVSDRNLEYSWMAVNLTGGAPISENSLNEQIGIQLYTHDTSERIVWGPTPPLNLPFTGVASVDWNQNGVATDILPNFNINSINTTNGKVVCKEPLFQSLPGFNDTAALVFNIRSDGDWKDGRSVGSGQVIESPFCLPVASIISQFPGGTPQQLINFFNSFRSCAGGRGETDPALILQAYKEATILNGTVTPVQLNELVQQTTNQSSNELTPDDMITMRLSRIDSIMTYLNYTPDNYFTGKKILILLDYTNKTNEIKVNIENHKLLDVLKGLNNLYDSYSVNIIDPTTLKDLKSGTADIYNSINKAVLGSPMIVTGYHIMVVQNRTVNTEKISDIRAILPNVFDDNGKIIVQDYPGIIKHGKLLVTDWELVKEDGKDLQYHVEPPMKPLFQIKMYNIQSKDVTCKEGLKLIFKVADGSAKCVSSKTAPKLVAKGWATK